MSSKIFLQALQNKLKGGNARSIHLNALPGRLATRLDIKNLDLIEEGLSKDFLHLLLSRPSFEFKVSFDSIDLNERSQEEQKRLLVLSKRLNSIIIENEDYYKEHGSKTLGFGYPILIRRSTKDPTKIIKAPLFIWPLDAIKSRSKVNEWSFLRNRVVGANGNQSNADIHSVGINEVLLSFIKGEDNIMLPSFNSEALDDMLIDREELLEACAKVIDALNSGTKEHHLDVLERNFRTPVVGLPDTGEIDEIANNNAYIHFGGVLGLFRAQKESIISDIARLLERFDEFEFDKLVVGSMSETPFSAVSTDPAQQAILTTLGYESNQIIQGPPGTGKSQSLTALVTNALANGLKCLVVCEKKTALDVIKSNIERTHGQMVQLVAVIDDVNEDRESIVDSVRDRQNTLPLHQQFALADSNYVTSMERLKAVTSQINSQHRALDKIIYNGRTWGKLVGKFLALRKKFDGIPLRDVLDKNGFRFVEDEHELRSLLEILGKGNVLFRSSEQYHAHFDVLSDKLFQNVTVGESRLKIEEFAGYAVEKYPQLGELIREMDGTHEHWYSSVYLNLHEAISGELAVHLPFVMGRDYTAKVPLPKEFVLESKINACIGGLENLLADAVALKAEYTKCLAEHYEAYRNLVGAQIQSYKHYVDGYVAEHGDFFFDHSTSAKLKTNLFGIFSKRYQKLKFGRSEHAGRVNGIRIAQQSKAYLAHDYIQEYDPKDYRPTFENITSLDRKLDEFGGKIPMTVESFVSDLSRSNCHKEFGDIGSKASQLFERLGLLTLELSNEYGLVSSRQISELNELIQYIPELRIRLDFHLAQFASFRNHHAQCQDEFEAVSETLLDHAAPSGTAICDDLLTSFGSVKDILEICENGFLIGKALKENIAGLRGYADWRSFLLECTPRHNKLVLMVAKNTTTDWRESFECWYLFWLLSLYEPAQLPKNDDQISEYAMLKREFNDKQLSKIMAKWMDRQAVGIKAFKQKGMAINSLFNKKGAKGMRRNSLRTIIRSEFQLFTDFFPVVLLNPSVCSSVIPLEEGIFDLVIFDEASQLRLEDTYPSLIRGKAKIVSGDKHQMAPSSYFEGSGALLDPFEGETENEDEIDVEATAKKSEFALADSESLLAFAVDKNFKESYLKIHYRSQHPYLIDFSNHAFYGERLIPVPPQTDYVPIEFIKVDGIYDNQTNRAEALRVVEILKNEIPSDHTGSYPSVGVATFNIYQRNLILEEISAARRDSPSFDAIMDGIGDSFFVKNLENIQGDERDVIIISTTFGRKTNGTFSQSFGPIIQGKGHRMLNVIVTRAKQKVFVCNSFPEEYTGQFAQLIQEKGNKGRAILYAYLNYARAVSQKNDAQRQSILSLLGQHCTDQHYDNNEPGLGSESPFEDEVFSRLAQHIGAERIQQQLPVGGFRIDMVVHPKSAHGKRIAIECDGAKYHSSAEAYAWDVFRQQQIEKFGFVFHRIWSTNWWDSPDTELERLLDFIRRVDSGFEDKGQASLF